MKAVPMRLPLLLLAALSVALPTRGALFLRRSGDDRAITKVIKMLEVLMQKAQKEGDDEHQLYAKFKCHCDTTSEAKNQNIALLTDQIEMHKALIAKARANAAELSTEAAQLKADIATNEEDQDAANKLRTDEAADFATTKEDLESAIGNLKDALDTLSTVNAEQNAAGADHAQYMGDVAGVQKATRAALLAASSFVTKGQAEKLDAFLQGGSVDPAYSSKSGAIFGILANMKDTFAQNLQAAKQKEDQAIIAHDKFVALLGTKHTALTALQTTNSDALGVHDGLLAEKTGDLGRDTDLLNDENLSLGVLQTSCKEKSDQHDSRKTARASEQAALSQAIAILNSDAAFATFGKVAATGAVAAKGDSMEFLQPAFVQLRGRVIRPHVQAAARRASAIAGGKKQQAAAVSALVQARGSASVAVRRILSAVQAGNPFKKVLEEIQKMIKLIGDEGVADSNKNRWCTGELESTGVSIGVAKTGIQTAEDKKEVLKGSITDLAALIVSAQEDLEANHVAQQEETTARTSENKLYLGTVKDAVEASAMLKQALEVLKGFYAQQSADRVAPALIERTEPTPAPATWGDEHQSTRRVDDSSAAITALQTILTQVGKDLTTAHADESENQHLFEQGTASTVGKENTLRKTLVTSKSDLAADQQALTTAELDLATHTEEELALKSYLENITPGCDFIKNNLETRETDRVAEEEELGKAKELLEKSPAYVTAMEHQTQEALGDCKDICNGSTKDDDNKESVECKACLAKVSVPGYCAGHRGQPGCEAKAEVAPDEDPKA